MCSLTNATAGCSSGACTLAACTTGFGDCNGNPADGCETNTNTSTSFCGSCTGANHQCAVGGVCSSGVCACPAGQTNCSGTCTSTQATDAANCGACGHGCIGGTCSGGVCQRFTVANAAVTSSPAYLAADATNLYWADDGLNSVLQVPVAQPGSMPVTLSHNALFVYFQGIAVSGSTLIFTTDDSAVLTTASVWQAKVGVANQTISPLDSFTGTGKYGTISAPAINAAGTIAYVTEDPEDSLGNHTVALALYACTIGTANACSSLTSISANVPSSPFISGSFLFFTDYSNAKLDRYTLPSGPLTSGWVAQPSIAAYASDGSRVFFTYNGDGTGSTIAPAGAVASAANGSVQPLGYANLALTATSAASDGKFVYFSLVNYSTNPSTGSIQYTPVAGGGVQTLYTGTTPRAVVAANGGIYWIDGTNIYGQRFP
jgi:hypothetical protein